MRLYICATTDTYGDRPHIFYSEDFTDADIGSQYEVLKSFFVEWYDPDDSPFITDEEISHYVRPFEGRYAIRIPKGDIITITDVDNGSFEFETGDFRFWVDNEGYGFDIPIYMRCIKCGVPTCNVTGASDLYAEDEDDDYNAYGQHSEDWYIARDRGEDTEPFV